MPVYCFQSEEGHAADFAFASTEAPTIGSWITVRGKRYRRIASFVLAEGQMARRSLYPYVSNALPPTIKGAKLVREKPGSRRKPLVESRKHENELIARYDLTREGTTFNTE